MNLRIIKENLERKLGTLREYKDSEKALLARHDLEEFICRSQELAPLMHRLIDEDRVPSSTLQLLYDDYMSLSLVREPKERSDAPPAFYTKELEERLHLHHDFVASVEAEYIQSQKPGFFKTEQNGPLISDFPDDSFRIERLCNDLLELLSNPSSLNGALPNLAFDSTKSRLYVRGTEVEIRKFSDQYHTLCVILEKSGEVSREWFFSEIAERVDEHKPGDKRYYNAVYQIREKLAKEGFPEFFITTKQSVKINPKYLS